VDEDSGATVIDVLGNDTDADGDALTVTGVGTVGNGTVSLVDGVISYTPNADFHGTDSFTYTISDGQGGTATATVKVTVKPVNDGPDARDDVYTTTENTPLTITAPGVLANDYDVDGDTLTALLISAPVNGTLVLNGDGSFIYNPIADFNGTDEFTYAISDGQGDIDVATVTIVVKAVDAARPVITFDDGATPAEVFTTDDPTRILVRTNDDLRIVDPTTGDWHGTVGLGVTPMSFTMSPDRRYAYVGAFSTDSKPVTKIDLDTGATTLIGEVRQPSAMVVSPDGDTLYVTNRQDGTVAVIDTVTGASKEINTGLQSNAVAVSADNKTLYVGSIANDVRVVDIETGTYTVIQTGASDGWVAADQSITVVGNRVYVTDGTDDKVAVIDAETNAIMATYDVGAYPKAVAVLPEQFAGDVIFVANAGADSVTVITTEHGVIGEIEVGPNPTDVDVVDGFVYVTTSAGIAVISGEEIAGLLENPSLEA
jgi:YVTN family beta-propeller protein